MLSIIISSYREGFFSAIERNIAETIGIPYEIIKIDNPNAMGICEAYNKGANKAKFDYFLFLHEDILFHTKNWGQMLINHLSPMNVGIIGLAGSNYVPIAPTSWSIIRNEYTFCNVNRIQYTPKKSIPSQKVFALDGVFLAIKKSVFNEFLFDEDIKGFHGYDTDFSLRVATKYNNYVVWNIFLEHFSTGNPNRDWVENTVQIRKKIRFEFDQVYNPDLEIHLFYTFLNNYFQYHQFNLVNINKTFDFLPRKISLKNKFLIFNEYLHYLFRRKTFI